MTTQRRKRIKGLPYWPTQQFIKDSIALLREKGATAHDDELTHQIRAAYQLKRREILEEMTITKL